MDWVEAQAKTVEAAIEAAMADLGIVSVDQAKVEVVQEPKTGFLGMGGVDAIVKVSRKPARRRRRKPSSGKGRPQQHAQAGSRGGDRTSGSNHSPGSSSRPSERQGNERRSRGGGNQRNTPRDDEPRDGARNETDIATQAQVAEEFLRGLLDAFGLEGAVSSRIEDDILWLDLAGDQTEALIGARGAILQSLLELTRTVVQRNCYGAPRMRLDIAGYSERRREALKIYAGKLADKVLSEGGEVMLEPMNPADRKVVHDAVAEIEGVGSHSEGEDPDRSVVIAATS